MAVLTSSKCQILDILLIIVAVSSVRSDNLFFVTHSPTYLDFKPADAIPLSQISSLQLSTYGLSPDQSLEWNGLSQKGLFKKPKANVIFSVHGLAKNNLDLPNIAQYPVNKDDVLDTTVVSDQLQRLLSRTLTVDFSEHTSVFDVMALYPELFHGLSSSHGVVQDLITQGKSPLNAFQLGSLNATQEADLTLLSELEIIHEIIDVLEQSGLSKDKSPDMFHFSVNGINRLIKSGASQQKISDALKLLQNFINEMTKRFVAAYKDNVVVQVITLDDPLVPHDGHRTRTLKASEDPVSLEDDINLSQDYRSDYSAIFNIIIWTVIFLAITIFLISYGMWNMDPGRDSIIYRMTSQRMKME